jgi:phosphoserine phosphatase
VSGPSAVDAIVVTLVAAEDGVPDGARRRALDVLGPEAVVERSASPRSLKLRAPGAAVPALTALRLALAGDAVDVAVEAADAPAKRLFIADMDSTMIGQECIDELADHAGLRREVAEITERAMRGELAFEPALEARVALLAGLPLTVVDAVLAERITPNPGAAALLAGLRARGAFTALVSGGFTLFTGPIAARIGFHAHRANVLRHRDGVLDGSVETPILGRAAKRAALMEFLAERSLAPGASLAIGDGANDVDMVEAAGLGVAYRAKPALKAVAGVWLDHAPLDALLDVAA